MSCHKMLREIKGKTDLTIALAGNPNAGKSCIFNQLTGLSVVTANYLGKTVELIMGVTTHNGLKIGIVDLPGTYAISAYSDDQLVARRGVLEGRPDLVVVVVDASNLQRNLYISLQFLELGFPIVVMYACVHLVVMHPGQKKATVKHDLDIFRKQRDLTVHQ